MRPEIIYVGDPMCSWCYGFSPVMQAIFERHRDQATMSLRMGGLHPGNDYIVDQRYKDFLIEHWTEIGGRTGQKFSFGILDELGWIYDTEKACRAVVAVRRLKPGSEYPFSFAIQAGFYAHNRNPHEPDTFAKVAEEFGVDRQAFLDAYADPAVKEETAADFQWAQSLGVTGFPTVLVRDHRGMAVLTRGYQPLASIERPLEQWLEQAAHD